MSASCIGSPPRLYNQNSIDRDNETVLSHDTMEKKLLTPTSENTAFLFDWDDTLLASSWLASHGLKLDSTEVPLEVMNQLRVLEQNLIKLLTCAMEYGQVHLVTNAENGWIELSAQKFLPGVVPLLPFVKIISARTSFEKFYPNQPKQWKIEAFRHQLDSSFDDMMDLETKTSTDVLNIVSFGDSTYEREALMCVTKERCNALSKSIKFVERPTMEQLQRQLDLIHGCMDHIATFNGNLDLMLTIQLLYK